MGFWYVGILQQLCFTSSFKQSSEEEQCCDRWIFLYISASESILGETQFLPLIWAVLWELVPFISSTSPDHFSWLSECRSCCCSLDLHGNGGDHCPPGCWECPPGLGALASKGPEKKVKKIGFKQNWILVWSGGPAQYSATPPIATIPASSLPPQEPAVRHTAQTSSHK